MNPPALPFGSSDFLSRDELLSRVPKSPRDLRWQPQVVQETTSTNDLARQAARQGALAGWFIVADRQTQGRGRLGRAWESPLGAGLYLSLLLRPTLAAEDLGQLVLLSSVATRDAVEKITGLSPQIKWPNDLLVEGKKLAGLLLETEFIQNRLAYVIVGVGLNVHHRVSDFSPEVADRATSLFLATGKRYRRADLIIAWLEALTARLAQPFSDVLAEGQKQCITLGQYVRIKTGESFREGVAEGLDDTGALLLRCASGFLERVSLGEVSGEGSK